MDETIDKYGRFDKLPASNPYLPAKCESNPELNIYIKKPKFSRNQFSYDVTRENYEDKFSTMDSESLDKLLTIIMSFKKSENTVDAMKKYAKLGTQIYLAKNSLEEAELNSTGLTNIEEFETFSDVNISTPYVFFADNHFDFRTADVDFKHIIKNAESQMADVIGGSFVDLAGKWKQSCIHTHLQNYTLDVWTGKVLENCSFFG